MTADLVEGLAAASNHVSRRGSGCIEFNAERADDSTTRAPRDQGCALLIGIIAARKVVSATRTDRIAAIDGNAGRGQSWGLAKSAILPTIQMVNSQEHLMFLKMLLLRRQPPKRSQPNTHMNMRMTASFVTIVLCGSTAS